MVSFVELLLDVIQAFPPPLSVLFFGSLFISLVGILSERSRIGKAREVTAVLVGLGAVLSVYFLYDAVQSQPNKILVIFLNASPPPLGACFEIDMLSVFMSFSVAFLGFLSILYSVKYMEQDTRLTEYYTLLVAMMAGMVGVAFAGDLFTLFIFWEAMSITSYALVAFRKERWAPIEAAFKFLIMGALGSTVIFFAMSLLYGMAGTVNFAHLSTVIRNSPPSLWLYSIFGLLLVGFGIKSSIVPMHTWLPDAHPEAPSPISAMLSGMLIETGLYGLTRTLYILFDPGFFRYTVASFAVLTMCIANIMALLQQDIKRLLAYSSIAQVGYMLIGVSAGTTRGLLGCCAHIFNHSLMKGLAFLSSGSLIYRTEMRDIGKLKGIGRHMPITTLTFFIALLGLGGVPTTNGFISKFILFSSAIEAGMPILAIIGLLNSAFSMAYYLRVIKTLISEPEEGARRVKEAPKVMLFVTCLIAALIVLFGIYPEPPLYFADKASRTLTEELKNYITAPS